MCIYLEPERTLIFLCECTKLYGGPDKLSHGQNNTYIRFNPHLEAALKGAKEAGDCSKALENLLSYKGSDDTNYWDAYAIAGFAGYRREEVGEWVLST